MAERGRISGVDLLICSATAFESNLLRQHLSGDASIRIIETGVGPVNAAHALTLAIVNDTPKAVVVCGVGGAYPGSGLAIGDVACASVEIYGDLGAQSPKGFLDMKALGFAVAALPTPLFNELPMVIRPAPRSVPFVTVSTCTGTSDAAEAIRRRTGGAIENMEGAAIAHVAHLHGIPAGEIRGVSNDVTNRDTSQWRLKEASAAAQHALLDWLAQR